MTIVRARWYPASISLPDQAKPWQRCYAIAADDGLHVFRSRSERAQWHSGIEWATTVLPSTDGVAKAGFTVNTEDGPVVITLSSGGCRCGSLGSWRGPEWARAEEVRV